jgi:hypothetical protein
MSNQGIDTMLMGPSWKLTKEEQIEQLKEIFMNPEPIEQRFTSLQEYVYEYGQEVQKSFFQQQNNRFMKHIGM